MQGIQGETQVRLPSVHDWRTTDAQEIERRRLRAIEEQPRIENIDSRYPIFSNFRVHSTSGIAYQVELRDLALRQISCSCLDFRINGLGTCKHSEAVMLHLEARYPVEFEQALNEGSPRIEITLDGSGKGIFVERGLSKLPKRYRQFFDENGELFPDVSPDEALDELGRSRSRKLRLSQDIETWMEMRRRTRERKVLRREYEQKVHDGIFPQQETKVPLYPYQREGMLHLAFNERALLADEMGLGKTIQAVAACALLHRLGKANRVIVVSPASLKTEWEEQIQRFSNLPYQIIFGHRLKRLKCYLDAPFFTLVNYEQMRPDALDVNARLKPDIVILDEAQRIKNWSTKTARAVKRLQSRYAFVLTGTPIENKLDELYSIVDFLDPTVFGPLFRFNREFYTFNDRGRPEEYQNLERVHERIRPVMVRRRKLDVENELPNRTDHNLFVPMSDNQRSSYEGHEAAVARLIRNALKRPLTQQEQEKLQRELAMMRMICDTNYILDPDDRVCPKLRELEKVLDDCLSEPGVKTLVFSEWVRMLELVREMLEKRKIGYALHTGEIPQKRRRGEIQMFKTDPQCRVMLCSESGGVGLNLQNASVVINCDLPWNPARLEQRIARAWRKHQTRNVTVINLVSEKTIEHRMLSTLESKKGLAEGVLDREGDLKRVKFKGGQQTFLKRIRQVMEAPLPAKMERKREEAQPVDRSAAFAERSEFVLKDNLVACEERFPLEGAHSLILVVVERDAGSVREKLKSVHDEYFPQDRSDPLAPVNFDVIDRATAEALERLEEAGMVNRTVRATRHLYPTPTVSVELSDEEQGKIKGLGERMSRKLKMAKLLIAGDMKEEAREPLLEAIWLRGCMFAIENRVPEPKDPSSAVDSCLGPYWEEHFIVAKQFVEDSSQAPDGVIEVLGICRT